MKRPSLLLSVICVASLPACVVVTNPDEPPPRSAHHYHNTSNAPPPSHPAAKNSSPPPAQPAYQAPPPPTEQPVEEPKSIAEGRPAGLHSGAGEAYWIWHDAGGWHLRTTTRRAAHRFQGFVSGMNGQVERVRATRLEFNDRFRPGARSMGFDFVTDGFEDGFDFQLAESDCAQFNIFIDGRNQPDRVNIGAGNRHPGHGVFRLCK